MFFFPQTVYCWGPQFYLKMCPHCVRGGVRLLDGSAIMCLPLSPFICLPLSPFICVSGAVSAFWTGLQSFVPLCLPLFVSLCLLSSVCQGWCPPSGLAIICLPVSPFNSLLLSPFICVSGAVSAFWTGLQSFVSFCVPSFVSFCLLSSVCQGWCPPSGRVCNHVSPFVSLYLSPFVSFHLCVRGGVRLLDWSAIICLPLSPCNSLLLSPFICVSGVVSAFWTGLQSFVSLCLPAIVSFCLLSSVCQGRCPPSGLVCNHLSPFVSLQ